MDQASNAILQVISKHISGMAFITSVGTCLEGQYCSMQGLTSGKTTGDFSPPEACIASFITMKASHQEELPGLA